MPQKIPTGWHRADIVAALRKKGTPLAEMARRLGYAPSTLSWALMKPHPRANAAIAEALGVPMHELWPAWYDPNGELLFNPAQHNRDLEAHSTSAPDKESNLSAVKAGATGRKAA